MSRRVKAADLIAAAKSRRKPSEIARDTELIDRLTAENARLQKAMHAKAPKFTIRRGKATKHLIRVIVPDSHGEHIDISARDAFLRDVGLLCPDEAVFLGDHLDCGGTFNAHQRTYSHELTESFDADVLAANDFLDRFRVVSPNSRDHYIEGNHEQHIERWVARSFTSYRDALRVVGAIGPEASLRLKARGVTYYKRSEHYMGLSIPGAIKLGKCFFVHGISHSKNADDEHLKSFAYNVVFGHVHRSMGTVERTVTCDALGAWCPGTLAKRQPLYAHTRPTKWTHGYGVQFVNSSTGTFAHWNVPIHDGISTMRDTIDAITRRAA